MRKYYITVRTRAMMFSIIMPLIFIVIDAIAVKAIENNAMD